MDVVDNFAQPGDWIGVKVFRCVVLAKKLHSQNSKNVDDNEKDECKIPQSTKCGDDDTEENFHGSPGLSQFQHPHLQIFQS